MTSQKMLIAQKIYMYFNSFESLVGAAKYISNGHTIRIIQNIIIEKTRYTIEYFTRGITLISFVIAFCKLLRA